jgi:hypothetical protein
LYNGKSFLSLTDGVQLNVYVIKWVYWWNLMFDDLWYFLMPSFNLISHIINKNVHGSTIYFWVLITLVDGLIFRIS